MAASLSATDGEKMVIGQFRAGLIVVNFNLRWSANNSTGFFLPFQNFGAPLINTLFTFLVVSCV